MKFYKILKIEIKVEIIEIKSREVVKTDKESLALRGKVEYTDISSDKKAKNKNSINGEVFAWKPFPTDSLLSAKKTTLVTAKCTTQRFTAIHQVPSLLTSIETSANAQIIVQTLSQSFKLINVVSSKNRKKTASEQEEDVKMKTLKCNAISDIIRNSISLANNHVEIGKTHETKRRFAIPKSHTPRVGARDFRKTEAAAPVTSCIPYKKHTRRKFSPANKIRKRQQRTSKLSKNIAKQTGKHPINWIIMKLPLTSTDQCSKSIFDMGKFPKQKNEKAVINSSNDADSPNEENRRKRNAEVSPTDQNPRKRTNSELLLESDEEIESPPYEEHQNQPDPTQPIQIETQNEEENVDHFLNTSTPKRNDISVEMSVEEEVRVENDQNNVREFREINDNLAQGTFNFNKRIDAINFSQNGGSYLQPPLNARPNFNELVSESPQLNLARLRLESARRTKGETKTLPAYTGAVPKNYAATLKTPAERIRTNWPSQASTSGYNGAQPSQAQPFNNQAGMFGNKRRASNEGISAAFVQQRRRVDNSDDSNDDLASFNNNLARSCSIRLILAPANYPMAVISKEIFEKMEHTMNLMLNKMEENKRIAIDLKLFAYRSGAIIVDCPTTQVASWIEQTVPRALKLTVNDASGFELSPVFELKIPCGIASFKDAKDKIGRLHRIDTRCWQMLRSYDDKKGTGQRFLMTGDLDLAFKCEQFNNGTIELQYRAFGNKATIRLVYKDKEAPAGNKNQNLTKTHDVKIVFRFKTTSNSQQPKKNWMTSFERSTWIRAKAEYTKALHPVEYKRSKAAALLSTVRFKKNLKFSIQIKFSALQANSVCKADTLVREIKRNKSCSLYELNLSSLFSNKLKLNHVKHKNKQRNKSTRSQRGYENSLTLLHLLKTNENGKQGRNKRTRSRIYKNIENTMRLILNTVTKMVTSPIKRGPFEIKYWERGFKALQWLYA